MLRSMKFGLYGAVLAGLVAAPAAWSAVDKTVNLVVDGQPQAVHTTASKVGDVLAAQGLRLSSHDLLAPGPASTVTDGSKVVLRRGRLLHLSIDGSTTDVWTTAPTVAEALSQLGYTSADFVSVSRSTRLPLQPTDIAIRTPRLVTVVHDGQTQQVTTTDANVQDLLSDLNITVLPDDYLSPAATSQISSGETITIQRVTKQTATKVQTAHFPVQKIKDPNMLVGTTKIVTPGKDGQLKVTYAVIYVDGKAVAETPIKSVVLSKPTPQVQRVGTRNVVGLDGSAASLPSDPNSAQAIARQLLAARGWGDDQFNCLVILWNHESGWRVNAANPGSGAYGIPQALPGSKMGSAGSDWQTSARTQILWGLGYIASRYGTPCGAWSTWQAHGGWY